MELWIAFGSALVLGLLGSLHCVSMCGGLQAIINQPAVIRTPRDNQYHLVSMNIGRVTLYSLAGALVGFFGAEIGAQFDVPNWSVILRQVTAVLIILIGLQLLLNIERPLAFLEKAGYGLWRWVRPLLRNPATMTYNQSFRRGLIWGFLPCGLVYSMLAIAVVSGSAQAGLLTMLGFGLGTLPALLLTGLVLWQFKQVLQLTLIRRGGGVFFIVVGILILLPTLMQHLGNLQHH